MSAPVNVPRVLLLGGVDPSGGAGLTTDARMAHALGVHPLPVVTCLTVQNRHGFVASHAIADSLLGASIRTAVEDGPVHAIKIGLLGSAAQLQIVIDACSTRLPGAPLVVDPVLSATSGGMDAADDLVAAYRSHSTQITVLTPNLPELDRLSPVGPEALLALGCEHVFVTGGHAPDADDVIEDKVFTAGGVVVLRHTRLVRGPMRGTGCALATAVASHMARGNAVEAACRGAVDDLVVSIERTPASSDGLPVPLRISAARSSA